MFETCFIHIGHSKTGTTAFQRLCFKNAERLREAGIRYPVTEPQHNSIFAAFHGEAPNFRLRQGKSADATANRMEERAKEIFAEIETAEEPTLLISTEHLNRLKPDEVQRLSEWCRTIARTTKIVCYARHPLSHATTKVQQRVKIRAQPLERIESALQFYAFADELPKWVDAFGQENVIVRPFEKDRLHRGDVVADLLDLVGFDSETLDNVPIPKNSRLSAPALLIADAVSRLAPRGQFPDLKLPALSDIKGPDYVLPAHSRAQIVERAEPHLAYLRDTFGIELTEPDFSGSDYLGPDTCFTQETVDSLARILIDAELKTQIESENDTAQAKAVSTRRRLRRRADTGETN